MITKIRKMMPKEEGQKGFTLVELIVVMAILAVLAGLAVPKFANILDTSKVKADVSNRDLVQKAVEIYQADKGTYPKGDFEALMKDKAFVGDTGYIKSAIEPSHPDGIFTYSSGKVTYENTNEKYDTTEEIGEIIPGYKE
jgi:prepilin-type N-terminal cleavage/methylation domain-containing protein